MSWNSFSISLVTLGALTGGLVLAETTLPLYLKPSIVLRASTGALPTADLQGVLAAEEAKAREGAEILAQLQARASAFKTINSATQQYVQMLDQRIREKQVGEWSSPTAPLGTANSP